jgi:hypothetical protein
MAEDAVRPRPRRPAPRRPREPARFKLITSNSLELFEERINGYVAQLDRDESVVDVKFSTAQPGDSLEYTALVQTQKTETGPEAPRARRPRADLVTVKPPARYSGASCRPPSSWPSTTSPHS